MNRSLFAACASFSLVAFGLSGVAQCQKWADVTMTVVLDGDVPAPKPINVAAEQWCTQFSIVSEDLVVDPATKAIANIVFMIDSKKTKLDISQLHPDLQKVPTDIPNLDNLNCIFVPHVLAIRAGQTLRVRNLDKVGHNANFSFFKNTQVNPLIPAGGGKQVETKVEEPGAIPVTCNIHPWMNAYVIITSHPYVGISDVAGKIKIEKLPAGLPLNFKLWHESQDKSIEELSVGGKKETWKKGSVELTLKEGMNDLGTVLIKPDRFKSK